MSPFVDPAVDAQWLGALRALGDDDLRPALVHVFDDPVRIERRVGDQSTEVHILDERGAADGVVSLARQQDEAD